MSEQGYFTATNIPIDGQAATASTVNTSLLGLINEFNKQVPITKISAEQSWQTWTPTSSGFSTNPIYIARYCKIGRICFFSLFTSTPGTSNASTFTLTLPFNAAAETILAIGSAIDNNSNNVSPTAYAQTTVNSNVLGIWISNSSWTGSGTKYVHMVGFYETTS